MAVKHALWASLLAILCQTTLAATDGEYGSFGAKVSDGSELKHYNALLDQLGHLANFQKLGAVQPGSPDDNYAKLSKLSEIYVEIVKENGNSYIPDYKSNTLVLKNIDSFRTYALESSLESAFAPSNETCGAAVVFLYPTLVASTLQDLKPEYIEPQSAPARIAALRQAAQQDLRNDRGILELMCNTIQLQPALKDFDNFLSMLRSDGDSFLMMIAAEKKSANPQPALTSKPKEPYPEYLPVAPQRPYVAAKAEEYANCAAVIGALTQYAQENGMPHDGQETLLQFVRASIVYSNADKLMQHYTAMLNSNYTQMRSHPEQIKYWMPKIYERCAADYNSDLNYIQTYSQDARNEFTDKAETIIKSIQSTR